MEEVIIQNKQEYLEKEYPFDDPPKLTDQKRCFHCDRVFTVGDYKVFRQEDGDEYICCPYTPDCNGTVIDWIDVD